MPSARIFHALAALALMALSTPAAAVLQIEITEGAAGARPIAVVPFGWAGEGNPPEDIAGLISNDLTRSGEFEPMDRQDHVSQPTRADEVRFGNWRTLGVDHVVIGRVQPLDDGPGYNVRFQLFDVARQEQMVGYSYEVGRNGVRSLAHEISDVVYEEITGERGAFSTRIAYVAVQGSGDQRRYTLQVSDYDGYNPRTILTSREPIMSPAWGPDGERLAYVSFEEGRPAIYVQRVASGGRKKVSSRAGINGAPAWSPGGDRLAVTLSHEGNPEIYVLDLASNEARRVTRSGGIDTSPVWTPDGENLIFTSDRSGGPQIYSIPVDRSERARRLTFEGNYNADPDISPDGERLTFVHRMQNGRFRIAVLDRGSELMRVVSEGQLDESPTFAPNGGMILFATDHRGRGVLGSVSTDGRAAARLSQSQGDVREPAWGPFRD
ncbi:Tol-Pal system beta propeller repeat protein TolB [Halofilum ochraceum]|uniref:Tol-Pal system beta propeller repeat protein TolB n=1 Tax=Halofilum ochraceum TaxID=1611323 RepID=UPI000A3E0F19|nr:Tol-Pal system beta propeller repeat protein TolB [Halofilum ochraceum]